MKGREYLNPLGKTLPYAQYIPNAGNCMYKTPKKGYHLVEIPKGEWGELSKIQEELDELKDAHQQGNKIMSLLEASDVVLALQGYLEKHFPTFTFENILAMTDATRRAWESGERGKKDNT